MKKSSSSAFLLPLSENVWALPTTERKARILQNFGFECRCVRCENNDPNKQLQPEQSAKTPPRSSPSVARRRGNRLLPVSRQSPTTHSKSASATVMSRAQKSLYLWPWMRNVCGMEMTAVSCHRRRSWHVGRNHTVSHFKRRNGLLRVAEAAVAAGLQHLHTRMNGSGAERAERGKKEERKQQILNVKMGCFFLTQVTGNYSLPIMFSNSQKKCPTSQHRPIYDSHYRPPLPQERKKKKERKRKEQKKPSNHNNAAITAATPTTPPTTGTAPRPAAL